MPKRKTIPTLTFAAARKNAHLTQKAAAEKLGISVGTLSNYEIGNTSPNYKMLVKMAEVYNAPAELLVN